MGVAHECQSTTVVIKTKTITVVNLEACWDQMREVKQKEHTCMAIRNTETVVISPTPFWYVLWIACIYIITLYRQGALNKILMIAFSFFSLHNVIKDPTACDSFGGTGVHTLSHLFNGSILIHRSMDITRFQQQSRCTPGISGWPSINPCRFRWDTNDRGYPYQSMFGFYISPTHSSTNTN